jgi:hypothetical protein
VPVAKGAVPPPTPQTPPKPQAPVPTAQGPTIDFQCPWCDATVKVGLELEGRQTPCPECKRIIKVPLQTKQQPKDWRKIGDGRPSGARRDSEAAPEGAWGTETGTSTVSRQMLEKAGLVEEETEPATLGQRIKQIVYISAGMVAVGLLVWWVWNYWTLSQRDRALAKVWSSLEAKSPELSREATAEINRALGELYTEGGRPEAALDYFRNARGTEGEKSESPSRERDAILIEVGLGIIELGGDKEQVKNKTHLPWSVAQIELLRTIKEIRSPEARAEAVRRACGRLMTKKQDPAEMVSGIAPNDKAEALAIIGLERWRANQTEEAEATAKRALGEYDLALKDAKEKKGPLPAAPSLAALYLLLKQPEKTKTLEGGDERTAFALSLGMLESQVRQGQPESVRAWANGLPQPLDKIRAYAVLAALMLEKDPKSTDDLDALLTAVETMQPDQMVEALPTGKPNISWLLWRVVRLAALAGHDDKAKKLAAAIPDPALKGRAQLEILRARLGRSTSKVEDTAADGVEKPALGPAKEILARHNARYGGMSVRAVDSWPEDLKPFGWIGVALGIQDKEGR